MRPVVFGYKPRHGRDEQDDAPIPAVGSYREAHDIGVEDEMDEEQSGVPRPSSGGISRRGNVYDLPPLPAASKPMPRLPNIGVDRPIFTLSVAADLLGLHPRTLRIYEEKRLVVPARTEGNRRRYSQNDIRRFQFIRRLTQGGVNLEGVRIILDMANELAIRGCDPEEIIERNLNALDSE